MTILSQARDNGSSLKIVGGDYHVTQTKEDIIVSLRYMDRLLGLDTSAKTVTVEPGIKVTSPFLTASKWAGPAWAVAELAWGRVSSVSRSILASHWLLCL